MNIDILIDIIIAVAFAVVVACVVIFMYDEILHFKQKRQWDKFKADMKVIQKESQRLNDEAMKLQESLQKDYRHDEEKHGRRADDV